MPTTFNLSSGKIEIRDTNGDLVFSTDERTFILTDYVDSDVVGQHVTPVRDATCVGPAGTFTDVDVDVDTVLATINNEADTVFGAFKVATTGITPMADGGWFVGNGTYMHAQFPVANTNGDPTLQFASIFGLVAYTFKATGGQLIFNERAMMRATHRTVAGTNTATMPVTTVDFKMFCGKFI
jgi:hypothetical protein